MCCIFTCCSWIIDFIQRLWTFTMSCCISSAVCCALMTASMSGIAMGYNYSLAEFIDLKETNVSVYLKRGVFDDEMTDNTEWRRSGHKPQNGLLRDSNLATMEPDEEEMPRRSGRRLDDSVFQSNDQNRFEGSLMKLTAKPPGATTTTEAVTSDVKMAEVIKKYPSDSLDQLKAIHQLLNIRNEQRANTINYDKTTTIDPRVDNYFPGARRMMIEPDSPAKHNIFAGDRAIPFEHSTFRMNPIRTAVPDVGFGQAPNWFLPKNMIPEQYRRTMYTEDYDNVPITAHTYPHPIRYKTGVELSRPTRPPTSALPTHRSMAGPDQIPVIKQDTRRLESSVLNRVRDKLLMDKANFPSFRKPGYMQSENEGPDNSEEVDYEEEAKRGIKVEKRKKRYINDIPLEEVIVKETSYAQYEPRAIFNKYVKKDDTESLNQNVSDQEVITHNVNINPSEIDGSKSLNTTTEILNINSMRRRNKSILTTESDDLHNATNVERVTENLSLSNISTEKSTVELKPNTSFSLKPSFETFIARIVKLVSS